MTESIPECGNEKNVSGLEIRDVTYGIAESGKLVDDVRVVDVDHSRLVAVQVKVEGFVRRPHHGSFVTYYLENRNNKKETSKMIFIKIVKFSFKRVLIKLVRCTPSK